MTNKTSDLFGDHPPSWARHTHSVLEAVQSAALAADSVATVIALPLPLSGGQVKIIARDLDNNVVFYTECPGADVGEILGILGVDSPDQDITEMTQVFEQEGMGLLDAAISAALINSAAHPKS